MKVAIIGAGISGISACRMLKNRGYEAVVFEKNNTPGGLVRCEVVGGHLFHKTGGHVFNATDKVVQDWFWSQFNKETEFISARRKAKIWLAGKFIGYPIENNIYQLGKDEVDKILSDILQLSAKGYQNPFSYAAFSDFLTSNFGNTLYDLYFKPYNEKIWRTNLEDVPLHWLEGKLPMPNYKQMLLSNVIREEEANMVHSYFYYPREGGSQFIVDRIATGLEVRCHTPVNSIERLNDEWIINGRERFDLVVYTGDIRNLSHCLISSDDNLSKTLCHLNHLKSNGTSNMLCETDDLDISWLYIPGKETLAHRIIYTGNFSDANSGSNKRKGCVVEFSGLVSEAQAANELARLPGHLTPVAYNYEPASYVIQESNTREEIQKIKSLLTPLRFYLTGRFAEWEYYNMDKAILAANNLVNEIAPNLNSSR